MRSSLSNRQRGIRGGTRRLGALAATLSLAALPTLVMASSASADASPELSANKTASLQPVGDSVKVTGTGFEAGVTVHLSNCDASVKNGTACDADNSEQVSADAEGSFTQVLKVPAVFGSTDCQETDCVIAASTDAKPTALDRQVTLPIAYEAKETPAASDGDEPAENAPAEEEPSAPTDDNPASERDESAKPDRSNDKPAETDEAAGKDGPEKLDGDADDAKMTVKSDVAAQAGASLSASKTSGINAAGETLSVRGSGFKGKDEEGKPISLFVVVCDTSVAAGGACDMANFKQVTVAANGTFSTSLVARANFSGGAGPVDCLKAPCGIQTSRVGKGADRTQEATLRLSFSAGGGGEAETPNEKDPGKPGEKNPGNNGSGGGGESNGSAPAAAEAPAKGVLPNTGAESLTLPIMAGSSFIIGGLALLLFNRRREDQVG